MSSDENDTQVNLREEQIDILVDNSGSISRNFEKIDWIFEDTFGSDRLHNNYDDYLSTMQSFLYDIVNEGEEGEVTLALINVVGNFDTDLYDEIKERDENLADNLRELSMTYGLDIQRRIQRVQQGHNYWNNIRSDLSVRSNRPAYKHELMLDYEQRIQFDSSLSATAILARHFVEQIADAPDVLGEDVFAFLDSDEIERINEISQSLLERIDEYEPEELEEPFAPEREIEESNADLDEPDTESDEE